MAHFIAQVQLYDCLDEVHFVLRWHDYDEDEHPSPESWRCVSGHLQGHGLEDPTKWLRGALEGIQAAL